MGQITGDEHDVWSNWLLHRDGGDPDYGCKLMRSLEPARDRILEAAALRPGMTMLDIGTGDGLIAFGAIDRVGPDLKVIFSDISRPMLRHVADIAARRGVLAQCTFETCGGDDLAPLWDRSVDVVTSRAALAFVANKRAAFAEFFRVLRAGGRISLCEPILQDKAFEAIALERLLNTEVRPEYRERLQLSCRFTAAQFPATEAAVAQNPLTNFCERDLVGMASDVGFADIHLELHIDVCPGLISSWDVFLNSSPHPLVPTSREILQRHFSAAERVQFEKWFRPVIEENRSPTKDAFAYLVATKPG